MDCSTTLMSRCSRHARQLKTFGQPRRSQQKRKPATLQQCVSGTARDPPEGVLRLRRLLDGFNDATAAIAAFDQDQVAVAATG
jgi:hypothetical protein